MNVEKINLKEALTFEKLHVAGCSLSLPDCLNLVIHNHCTQVVDGCNNTWCLVVILAGIVNMDMFFAVYQCTGAKNLKDFLIYVILYFSKLWRQPMAR